MDKAEIYTRAYSPRVSSDPLFQRDTIGVALFGMAEEQVAVRGGRTTLPAPGIPPLVSGAPPPPPGVLPPPPATVIPSPLTVPGELRPNEIISALPDTAPTIDDFTRHGTLPGFGDAARDPFGSSLRRRLTVLLRSM